MIYSLCPRGEQNVTFLFNNKSVLKRIDWENRLITVLPKEKHPSSSPFFQENMT